MNWTENGTLKVGDWCAAVEEAGGGEWVYLVQRRIAGGMLIVNQAVKRTADAAVREAEFVILREMFYDPSMTVGELVRRWVSLFPDCVGLRARPQEWTGAPITREELFNVSTFFEGLRVQFSDTLGQSGKEEATI